MSDQIKQIRAAHLSARPKPAVNPAWANAERNIGVLLAEIDRLRTALRNIAEGNLGGDPWQADYDKIRQVAIDAIAAPESQP